METTGVDFDKDEIITIQWRKLNDFTGEPVEELNILRSWESSEKEIIEKFIPKLNCRRWDFIFVGKNLLFDFCFLNKKMRQYNLGEIDLPCLYDRAWIDIKPLLIMMNNGKFIGYDKVLPKTNPLTNDQIPQLYRLEKCPEIIQYIKDEAEDFIKVYQILKKELPSLSKLLQKK